MLANPAASAGLTKTEGQPHDARPVIYTPRFVSKW
jgi:hypothetical protein